jgi:ABC-type glutathione transport system ATPase component
VSADERAPATRTTGDVLAVEGLVVHRRRRSRVFARSADVPAVRDASLTVGQGEIVGLVGESGSGKSTIASVAAGFLRPTAGTARLHGEDLFALDGRALRIARLQCQVIFQDPYGSLDPRQSISSALREIRRLYPERTAWTDDAGLLARVGLRPVLLGHYPHQLSGGEAQRVAIARAILVRPTLLVADEATSALDVSVQALVLNLLLMLNREQRIAILLISHDLAVVRQTCERVYVLHQGRIVEHGDTEQVLTAAQDAYTRRLIAASQNKLLRDPRAAAAGGAEARA